MFYNAGWWIGTKLKSPPLPPNRNVKCEMDPDEIKFSFYVTLHYLLSYNISNFKLGYSSIRTKQRNMEITTLADQIKKKDFYLILITIPPSKKNVLKVFADSTQNVS